MVTGHPARSTSRAHWCVVGAPNSRTALRSEAAEWLAERRFGSKGTDDRPSRGPRRGIALVDVAGGEPVRIPRDRILAVGRAATSDVPILDTTVSRRHAMVGLTQRGVLVTDLGSRNGTYVNGKRVTSAVLARGDVVSFGKAAFRVDDTSRRSA